jgi:SnoaL-like domain
MSTNTQCIDVMLSAWNTRNSVQLKKVVESSLASDVEFCDPRHDIHGHDAFIAMVEAFWAEHKECKIARDSAIDPHHDRARYAWVITFPNGQRFEGFDVVTLDLANGKVRRVDGFFGQLSPLSDLAT